MTRLRAVLGLAVTLSVAACFDSDDKFKLADATTTGLPTTTTGVDPSTTSSSTMLPEPDITCQDAIDCVFQCALEIQMAQAIEPDLSCFLACIEVLTQEEAVKLIELANCASALCEQQMQCDPNTPTTTGESSTSTGGDTSTSTGEASTSTGTDTGTDTSTSTGASSSSTGDAMPGTSSETGQPLLDPCLLCIFGILLDEATPGCEEFAMECD